MRRAAALTAWLLGLILALAVLVAAGHGPLAGPPLLDPGAWSTWARGRDPIDTAVAIVRTGLVLVVAYLLATTLLALMARVVALPRLAAGAARAGGPLVRRMVGGAIGAGLAVSTLAPLPAVAQSGSAPTAVMQLMPEDPRPMAVPPSAPEHVVEPGDSFWRIAHRHLESTLGRPPTDREVVRYWRQLIAANADRLATSDPNLIYPGQRFRLP